MKTPMANIPLALTECLQPSEVSGLVEEARRSGVEVGQVIVVALREFLSSRRPLSPAPAGQSSANLAA